MRSVVAYKILVEDNESELNYKIAELINRGYQPHGFPRSEVIDLIQYNGAASIKVVIYQGMIKYVENI